MFDLNNISKLGQVNISLFADFVIDLCNENYFDHVQSFGITQQLKKMKDIWALCGAEDHPSLAIIFSNIGNIILGTSFSQLAIPFFVEQLRIEKKYLGYYHPDLVPVLFNIGQIYEIHDQLIEAEKYFAEALSLLNISKRKGRLYASVIYNIGLINFRQSLYKDAMDNFDLAIIECEAAFGEFHPSVAEILMDIGKFQLEIGKLQEAMDNFLKALMIIRMAFCNTHSKVAECLYGIGMIHEARTEFSEALNVLNQAFNVKENDKNGDDDTLALVILHRIGMIYQSMENVDKSFEVFEKLKKIMKSKVSDDEFEAKFLEILRLNAAEHAPQVAAAA